jgi:hypothetical protein
MDHDQTLPLPTAPVAARSPNPPSDLFNYVYRRPLDARNGPRSGRRPGTWELREAATGEVPGRKGTDAAIFFSIGVVL